MATQRAVTLGSLEERLLEFEKKYEVSSPELDKAFRQSPLQETDDFQEWSLIYAAYQSAVSRPRR